jgi:hypothetical protein
MAIIRGKAYWTHIAAPNNKGKFPSNKYEIVIQELDPKSIAVIKELGMGKYIKPIAPENPAKGFKVKLKNKNRPLMVNTKKVPYPEDTLVGNGSQVICQIGTYTSEWGTFINWTKMMVEKLVEFQDDSNWEEFEEEGVVDADDSNPFHGLEDDKFAAID